MPSTGSWTTSTWPSATLTPHRGLTRPGHPPLRHGNSGGVAPRDAFGLVLVVPGHASPDPARSAPNEQGAQADETGRPLTRARRYRGRSRLLPRLSACRALRTQRFSSTVTAQGKAGYGSSPARAAFGGVLVIVDQPTSSTPDGGRPERRLQDRLPARALDASDRRSISGRGEDRRDGRRSDHLRRPDDHALIRHGRHRSVRS